MKLKVEVRVHIIRKFIFPLPMVFLFPCAYKSFLLFSLPLFLFKGLWASPMAFQYQSHNAKSSLLRSPPLFFLHAGKSKLLPHSGKIKKPRMAWLFLYLSADWSGLLPSAAGPSGPESQCKRQAASHLAFYLPLHLQKPEGF